MNRRTLLQGITAASITPLALAHAETPNAVFELRVYHCNPGKLDALLARFRDHTITIFSRHHIKSIAYWVPTDAPLAGETLFYVLQHPSRKTATENWSSFRSDPEWQTVQKKSEENGKLVAKVDSTFLKLTDFSPRI